MPQIPTPSPDTWERANLYQNADVRLVRADLSKMGTIRLSDLLKPHAGMKPDRTSRAVSLAKNRFEEFVFEMYKVGMMEMGEEIWWSAGPICNLLSKRMYESRGYMNLRYPLKNETLINGWNFEETVQAGFETFYKAMNTRKPCRLEIITFTMVIRPHRLCGEYRIPTKLTKLDSMFSGVVREKEGKWRRSSLARPILHKYRSRNPYHEAAHEFCSLGPIEACSCGP